MSEDIRQASGLTGTLSTTVKAAVGSGMTDTGMAQEGTETIQVEQVIGVEMAQRVVEFDMVVPDDKPAIEQVVDVYVKKVHLNSVDVIADKVIVRGDLEVKVMYVAALPDQPVHAFERSHIRFTRDIVVDGAEKGMKSKADVSVEYVNYDFDENNNVVVHITIVLKFWARVVSTANMDVYALNQLEAPEGGEVATASGSDEQTGMASQDKSDVASAAGSYVNIESEIDVNVSGPGIAPSTGTQDSLGGSGRINGNMVNVRTGPGTNFPSITQVQRGDMVTLKEQAFGWYKVLLADGVTIGWIAGWLVDTGQGSPHPKG